MFDVDPSRPDQIEVIGAIGDSITAGCFAKGPQTNPFLNFAEWRGVSYASGGDKGAITLPNVSLLRCLWSKWDPQYTLVVQTLQPRTSRSL